MSYQSVEHDVEPKLREIARTISALDYAIIGRSDFSSGLPL
jgi:hypothetical protein